MPDLSRYLSLACLLAFSFCIAFAQTPELDSMRVLATQQSGPSQIITWQEMGYQFFRYAPDSGRKYAQLSLDAARQQGLDSLEAEAYKYLGMHAFLTSDQEKAISFYKQAINQHKALGNAKSEASARANLGSAYNRLGNYEKALEEELAALRFFETSFDTIRQYLISTNIAELYGNIEVPRKSLEFAQKAFVLNETYSAGPLTKAPSANLGSAYLDMAEVDSLFLDSALYFFKQARGEYKTFQDPHNESVIHNNLGYVYELQWNYDSAFVAYEIAYKLNREVNRTGSLAKALANMAEVRIKQGKFDEASGYVDSAYHYMRISDETGVYQRVFSVMSSLAEAENRPTEALNWYRKSEALKDTLLDRERVRALSELQTQYETEKLNRQVAEQKAELAQAEQQQQQLILGSVIALAILVIIGGLAFYRYRLQQQAKLNAERLQQQQLRIRATLSAQEEERSRFARDLHDSVGQVLAATRLQFGAFDERVQDKEYDQALGTLDEACREVRAIAHTMMPRTLETEGLPSAVEELVSKIVLPTGMKAEVDVLGKVFKLSPEKSVSIYRILQELIQNVLKHAEASEVSIQLLYRKQQLQLRVEDDGKGLPPTLSQSGMGMDNIQLRSEAIGADFLLENNPTGKGTLAVLTTPQ